MTMNQEQNEFNFGNTEAGKPEVVEVPVEADEDKECGACGNLLASESPGCSECIGNEIKQKWQREHKEEETSH